MIKFTGHSDDIVVVEDANGRDEHYASFFYVVAPDDTTMAVVACYSANACWSFAPGLYEEGADLPPWPVSLRRAHDYSVELLIDAPEGSVVVAGEGE